MLTSRDKLIVYHVEKYGFVTIAQAYSIWFGSKRYGYDLSRKHLAKIEAEGYLKSYRPTSTAMYTKKIYYIEAKYATPNKSMVIAMDVYAELIRLGAGMIHFKREEQWFEGKYRSDAFTIVSLNNKIYSSCIEIIDTTKLSYSTHKKALISKYEEIYEDDEPVNKLIDITNLDRKFSNPKLIIISEIIPKQPIEINDVEVIFIDYSLRKLSQIFTTEKP